MSKNQGVSAYLLLKPEEQKLFTKMKEHPHIGLQAASMVSSFLVGQIDELAGLIPGQETIIRDLAAECGVQKLL